ncbi:MAG: hypothetical protein IKT40_05580 [Bacilli bacterium]|nr:hypothetical protein [Bacilli bacterium]
MENGQNKHKELLNKLIQFDIQSIESNYSLDKCQKFSLDKLIDGGLNLGSIINFLKTQQGVKVTGEELFRLIKPKDDKGGKLHFIDNDNSITYGDYNNGKHITTRAGFQKVASSGSQACASMNVYAMLITVAVKMITKKLDEIKETQLSMFEYLKLQEESKIKGNVITLQEISKEFQYNMENDTYKKNKHVLVQDIKRDAEQSIVFAKDLIVKEASKTKFFHFNSSVKNKVEKLASEFKNYSLSLYQFSYSSFLEVMLLENFDKNYLDAVHDKIIHYIQDFDCMKKEVYDKLLSDSKSSIESTAISGFAKVTKFLGDKAKKVSFLDKENVDDELLEISDKATIYNENFISTTVANIMNDQEVCSFAFAENIEIVNKLFNSNLDLIFDQEFLYIGMAV